MAISEQLNKGRAKNALLSYFEHTLSVPKIYIDADWNQTRIDVLAINRDGAGDVHAALLLPLTYLSNGDLDRVESWKHFDELVSELKELAAHFKYVVAIGESHLVFEILNVRREKMYADDGLGRIGLLQVVIQENDEPITQSIVRAERFRANVTDFVDNYIQDHAADWEIRV